MGKLISRLACWSSSHSIVDGGGGGVREEEETPMVSSDRSRLASPPTPTPSRKPEKNSKKKTTTTTTAFGSFRRIFSSSSPQKRLTRRSNSKDRILLDSAKREEEEEEGGYWSISQDVHPEPAIGSKYQYIHPELRCSPAPDGASLKRSMPEISALSTCDIPKHSFSVECIEQRSSPQYQKLSPVSSFKPKSSSSMSCVRSSLSPRLDAPPAFTISKSTPGTTVSVRRNGEKPTPAADELSGVEQPRGSDTGAFADRESSKRDVSGCTPLPTHPDCFADEKLSSVTASDKDALATSDVQCKIPPKSPPCLDCAHQPIPEPGSQLSEDDSQREHQELVSKFKNGHVLEKTFFNVSDNMLDHENSLPLNKFERMVNFHSLHYDSESESPCDSSSSSDRIQSDLGTDNKSESSGDIQLECKNETDFHFQKYLDALPHQSVFVEEQKFYAESFEDIALHTDLPTTVLKGDAVSSNVESLDAESVNYKMCADPSLDQTENQATYVQNLTDTAVEGLKESNRKFSPDINCSENTFNDVTESSVLLEGKRTEALVIQSGISCHDQISSNEVIEEECSAVVSHPVDDSLIMDTPEVWSKTTSASDLGEFPEAQETCDLCLVEQDLNQELIDGYSEDQTQMSFEDYEQVASHESSSESTIRQDLSDISLQNDSDTITEDLSGVDSLESRKEMATELHKRTAEEDCQVVFPMPDAQLDELKEDSFAQPAIEAAKYLCTTCLKDGEKPRAFESPNDNIGKLVNNDKWQVSPCLRRESTLKPKDFQKSLMTDLKKSFHNTDSKQDSTQLVNSSAQQTTKADNFEFNEGSETTVSHGCVLMLNFPQPASDYISFRNKIENRGISLENVFLRGCNVLGSVKVKSFALKKQVFVRCTFDSWSTFVDLPATPVPNNFCIRFETYSFAISVPLLNNPHINVEFAVCCNMKHLKFWDSNNGKNYKILSMTTAQNKKLPNVSKLHSILSPPKAGSFESKQSEVSREITKLERPDFEFQKQNTPDQVDISQAKRGICIIEMARDYFTYKSCLNVNFVALESIYFRDCVIFGTVRVRNVGWRKFVFVRCTFNSWKTSIDIPASFKERDILSGHYEVYTFEITVPADFNTILELAVCFEVDGTEHWDNNGSNNYKISYTDISAGMKTGKSKAN